MGETVASSLMGETRLELADGPGDGTLWVFAFAFCCFSSSRLLTAARNLANSSSSGLLDGGRMALGLVAAAKNCPPACGVERPLLSPLLPPPSCLAGASETCVEALVEVRDSLLERETFGEERFKAGRGVEEFEETLESSLCGVDGEATLAVCVEGLRSTIGLRDVEVDDDEADDEDW